MMCLDFHVKKLRRFSCQKVSERKRRYFADNSVGWHLELETNSVHQHVRLLMEISPRTYLSEKKYFDPVEEYVFQWRHLDVGASSAPFATYFDLWRIA